MIILRQKEYSWRSAKKSIGREFKKKSEQEYQEFWAQKGRNDIAKFLKRNRDFDPEGAKKYASKMKKDLMRDNLMVGISPETSAKIAGIIK